MQNRAELTALREETVPASAEQAKLLASREKELETLKAKVTELDALREEAVSLRGQGETEREGAEKKASGLEGFKRRWLGEREGVETGVLVVLLLWW